MEACSSGYLILVSRKVSNCAHTTGLRAEHTRQPNCILTGALTHNTATNSSMLLTNDIANPASEVLLLRESGLTAQRPKTTHHPEQTKYPP